MSDIAEHAPPPIPWFRIFSLATAQVVSWGTIYYSFTLFLGPMERELGWSTSDLAAGLTVAMLVSSLVAYFAGRWIDLYGGRALMTAGSLLAAILLAAMSQVDSQFVFYGLWAALGFVLATNLYDPLFTVLTIALRESAPRAITAVTLVAGFASTVFVPLTNLLIDTLGWRDAFLVLAAINLLVNVPIHATALKGLHYRDPPPPANADGRDRPAPDRPLRRAMRKPVFWSLLGTFFTHAFFYSSIPLHLIPLIISMDISKGTAVAVFAIIGPAQVLGRLFMAAMARILPLKYFGLVAFGLAAGGFALLFFLPASTTLFVVFAAFYGAANGMTTIVRATAVPEFLGRRGIGAIQGSIALPVTMMLAAAPYLASLIRQSAGSYDPVISLWFSLSLASVAGYSLAIWTGRRSSVD